VVEKQHQPIPPHLNDLTRRVLKCAYAVHTELGPGLLESVYRTCLAHEMALAGISFRQEVPLPIVYRELKLDGGLRPDFLIEEAIILEAKAIETLAPVHEAQVLSYLKLSGRRVGLLVNFNVVSLKNGIRRLVL
jgi:GxxExxY protein